MKLHVSYLRVDLQQEEGSPDGDEPGTKWEDVPITWTCPWWAQKSDFDMVEI